MLFQRVSLFFNTLYKGYKEYKLAIIILTILGFISALFEGIGVNALIPLFSFIINGKAGGDDKISKIIEKLFLFFNVEFRLKYLLVFISLLFILKAIIFVWCEYIRIKISADYEERVRNQLFGKFINADWPYLLKQKLGHLQTILMINVSTASSILSYISSFINLLTSLIIYTIIAFNINLKITFFSLILSGIFFIGFLPFIRKIRNFSYSMENANREIGHHINENILGMKTVKVMSVADQIINDAKKNFYDLKITKILLNVWQTVISSTLQPLSLIFVLAIFAFSYKSPNFNLAVFIAIIYLVKQIFSYTEALQKKVLSFNATIPYFTKISDYTEEAVINKEVNKGAGKFSFNDKLDLVKINFFYQKETTVLSDVNFNISKGEMVGLIGPSGAGKTTLVDLILRLFEPISGTILLDGKNIKDIDIDNWRKNIGYVSQDIFLINDTIANNIKFYNNSITDEEMIKASKEANIYDFIQECPNKFETIIGERGIQLSAGQRQRVVIARVLARRPQFLILDEATSALDNESEIKIQRVIENLKGKLTVFVIAHRLSTVINCDRLLVLENGRIIEQGSPSKLLEDKETYFYKVYNIRNK